MNGPGFQTGERAEVGVATRKKECWLWREKPFEKSYYLSPRATFSGPHKSLWN